MKLSISGKRTCLWHGVLFLAIALLLCAVNPVTVLAEQAISNNITYEYELTNNGTARILQVLDANPNQMLTLPEELDGYTVTAIGPGFLQPSASEEGTFGPVTISKTITQIDPLFLDCVTIKNNSFTNPFSIFIDERNPSFSYIYQDQTGCLIETETGRLICVIEKDASRVTIPEGVKILGSGSFHGLTISDLFLPVSLEMIEPGSLTSAAHIECISISEDNPVFFAYHDTLRDHQDRVYFPFDDTFPAEDSNYIETTESHEIRENREAEARRTEAVENTIGTILGVLVILVGGALLITIIVQFFKRNGHLALDKTFSELQVIFFGIGFLACCLLFMLIFNNISLYEMWETDKVFTCLLLGTILIYGITGFIVDLYIADSPFWAFMTVLFRLLLVGIAYGLFALENLLTNIFLLALAAFALLIVIRGAFFLIEGFGLARLFIAAGSAVDAMASDYTLSLTSADELDDFRSETPFGSTRQYLGLDGEFYKVKLNRFSNSVTVMRDGEEIPAHRMPDGSIHLDISHKADDAQRVLREKSATNLSSTKREQLTALLLGLVIFLPFLLIIFRLQYVGS